MEESGIQVMHDLAVAEWRRPRGASCASDFRQLSAEWSGKPRAGAIAGVPRRYWI